jgi:hypothetical protein
MNVKQYAYRVVWSEEDNEFVGLCAEFPSLPWMDKEQTAALSGIVNLVGEIVADMESTGEKIPQPLALQKYSGKFMIRTTPELYKETASFFFIFFLHSIMKNSISFQSAA